MGGCRCSYRSCTVRSDGQTHMFHFPVFDKIRCHRWISNAHKPEFLNLKLSQLKNRVICQHHFKDDQFMNFLRDKLKSTAIPSENGPYCTSNHMESLFNEEPSHPVIPINPEDIENDMLNSLEKKAHFSVKYGEFLTSDVTEMFNSTQPNIESEITQDMSRSAKSDKRDSYFELGKSRDSNMYTINYNYEMLKSSDIQNTKKILQNKRAISSVASIEFEDQSKPEASQSQKGGFYENVNSDKMLEIVSERNISEPIKVVGTPASVIILKRPLRKLNTLKKPTKLDQDDIKIELNNSTKPIDNDKSQVVESSYQVETVPIEYVSSQKAALYQNKQENQPNLIDINSIRNQNNHDNVASKENDPSQLRQVLLNCVLQNAEDSQKNGSKANRNPRKVATSSKSLLKSKVTPEKLAAIEQKRKFNMKLRDVISSCLNNLDEQNENASISQEKKQANEKAQMKVPTIPPKSPSQSNVIAYLESRLKKMEDTLLNKIDNNTSRINELKKSVKPSASNKKSVNTQTYINHMTEKSQKEYLYKEISKFLSPEANIKIYEELFIENHKEHPPVEPTPRKLRKRR